MERVVSSFLISRPHWLFFSSPLYSQHARFLILAGILSRKTGACRGLGMGIALDTAAAAAVAYVSDRLASAGGSCMRLG